MLQFYQLFEVQIMNTYRFKLSRLAVIGCIAGILLGLFAIGSTLFRIYRNRYSDLSVPIVLQYVVVLLVGIFALALFAAILIRSAYNVSDTQIVLWFGFIKSVYPIADIERIHLFTLTNKLVLYLKDGRYTVIVVKPEWYHEFAQDVVSRKKSIRFDISEKEPENEDDGDDGNK